MRTKLDQELELMTRAMNVSKFLSCFPPKIVLWYITELCKQDIYFALCAVGMKFGSVLNHKHILVTYNSQTHTVPVVVTVMACIIGDSSPTSICMTIKHLLASSRASY